MIIQSFRLSAEIKGIYVCHVSKDENVEFYLNILYKRNISLTEILSLKCTLLTLWNQYCYLKKFPKHQIIVGIFNGDGVYF